MNQRTILLFASLIMMSTFLQSCKPTETAMQLPAGESEQTDVNTFMEQAVYNGMVNDNFPMSTALHILDNTGDFFVGKCPICRPTESGIKYYITYLKSMTEKSTSRTKVKSSIISAIEGGDKAARLSAFNELLQGYTTAHKERLNLSEAKLQELNSNLQAARKKGMALKSESFGAFCPACDAACEIKD